MVQGKVEICGVNTAKLPLLKAADKDALFAKIREGDTAARESYIEGNLRLVLSVIKRFSSSAENVDDLFQIGCIGLIKAIDNFDPAQNVRFSTYGVPMIIGEIRRFLRDNNALRVSRSLRDAAYKAMQARETLEKQLGREPTVDEVARQAGLSRREVNAALESVVEPGRAPLHRWRRCHVCHRSGARPGQRGQLDQRVGVPADRGRADPARKADHGAALPQGRDPDGGGAGDRHQPGTGQPARKGRAGTIPQQIAAKAAHPYITYI